MTLLEHGRYRKKIEQQIYDEAELLQRRVKLANNTEMYFFTRPNNFNCLDDIIDFFEVLSKKIVSLISFIHCSLESPSIGRFSEKIFKFLTMFNAFF